MYEQVILEGQLQSLQLSPSPPSPQPSIPALPFEVVLLILEEASRFHDSTTVLRETALVAPAWKEPSMVLLHRHIWIGSDKQGRQLAASPALGRYTTWSLVIRGTRGQSPATAKILGAVQGLRSLWLRDTSDTDGYRLNKKLPLIPFSFLCTPNLSTLTSLSMHGVHLQLPNFSKGRVRSFAPHFTLESLSFGEYSSQADNLFTCFIKTSPECLHFDRYEFSRTQDPDLHQFVLGLSGRLKALTISIPDTSSLVPLFSLFINLQHLDISCPVPTLTNILSLLPLSLTSLTYSLPIMKLESAISAINSSLRHPSLRMLSTFNLTGYESRDLEKLPEGRALAETLRSRGVVVGWR